MNHDIELRLIAQSDSCEGFSGADLANLINEAALLAARGNKKIVSMNDLVTMQVRPLQLLRSIFLRCYSFVNQIISRTNCT